MTLGPITDGENGWKVAGSHDQAIVDRGGGNFAFRMSSDPSSGDFGGPYSPELSVAAGETGAGAAFDGQSIKFNFQAVNATPDGSRLEVDFGNAAGADRNNFLVIESSATTGIRIAVSEPSADGQHFSGEDNGSFPTDWRELATGVDPSAQHTLEMRLDYTDGVNNDRIDIYLDGQYIGQTTTFENYHDGIGGAHDANAAANFTDRVFFRGGANGAPQDTVGQHNVNEGFYFDNLTTSVYNNTSGAGNGLANIITGNSGDNLLTGLGGADTLNGGLGIDTAVYQDARSNYDVTVATDGHGRVTGFSQVQETGALAAHDGSDGLTSIERLQFSDVKLDVNQKVQLFDGADHLVGTFDHIQDAINAGADGYRIRLAAGSYDESVDISKNIEIDGVNAGAVGTGSRGAESVIRGQVTVSAAHSATNHITVNGVEVYNTSDNSHPFVGIQVNSAADVTVTNSVFFSPVINGSNTVLDRAILLTTAATGTINVDHNLFTGAAHSAFGSASWTTAIWSDGREAAGSSIDHNTFEWVRTAINADDFNNGLAIANNTFQNAGSGISIGGAGGGVNADVANITSIAHNTFTNVDTDFNLQNITAANKPIGLDLTAADNRTSGPSSATVLGGASGDTIKGSVDNDILIGNNGNDTLAGGAGDDNIQGSAGAGDIAVYDNLRANYTIDVTATNNIVTAFNGVTESTVVGTNEGHDTLTGIEILQFSGTTLNLNQAVQVFHGGNLIGTFDIIQDGVNAAVAGDTVLINGNIQSTFNESVTVSAGITLKGIGSVTINGGASSALAIAGGGAAQSLVIDNVDLVANSSGTPSYVVSVANTAQYASFTLQNGNVTGGAYAGFFLDNATGVSGVTIQNAQFSGAASIDSLSSGESEIYFYHYNGNVTLSGVSVTNSAPGLEYGIQLVGQSPATPMGNVSFSNVTVDGTYVKAGVAADTFSNASGLSFIGSGLTVNVSAGFAGINFDNIGGTIDLSGQPVSATNSNPSPTAFDIDLQGTSAGENFHGTNNDNFFNGKAGADILTGGSGNDVFFHVIGDGADTISGGGQTTADVLLVAGQGGFTGPVSSANETVSVQLDGSSHITSIDTASVAGVELIALDMGGGTDTLDYTGNSQAVTVNLATGAATGFSSIAPAVPTAIAGVENVIGGSNADALTGSSAANVLSGLLGADIFKGGLGNDTLYGEADTGVAATDNALSSSVKDAASYDGSFATFAVTLNPDGSVTVQDNDTVANGNEGTDTLHGVELLQFGGGATLDLTDSVRLFDSSNHLIGTFGTLKAATDAANADAGAVFTIRIAGGDVNVGGGQVVINKNITVDGAGIGATTIHADFNTGTTGDTKGLILVNPGHSFNMSNLAIDGTGHDIVQGVRDYGSGTFDHVHFANIQAPGYAGAAIVAFGGTGTNVDVTNSNFTDIGREGVLFFGAGTTGSFSGNTYTGKGAGDHLDYAAEVGAGAHVTFTGNTVSGNLGVASVDGSTSSGFLVTDFFGPGSVATFTSNTVTNSTSGVSAGFNATDASTLHFGAGNHFFSGVGTGVSIEGNVVADGTALVDGTFDWDGGAAANNIVSAERNDILQGNGGNDTFQPNGGNDSVSGGAGIDTVTYAAGYDLKIEGGHWVAVKGGETDTLFGVEQVVIDGTKYLLVDKFGADFGGFQHVQDAINFASGGENILIAPDTYSESAAPTEASATAGGLYINKPNLTLQGVDANGVAITTASAAQSLGATIVAGNQTDFSAQHFVGVAAVGLTIQGLHLKTGSGEFGGKLLEVWANNVTIKNDFLDVNNGGPDYSFATAVYFNDNGTTASDNITSYTVDNNILNEGIIIANGVGNPSLGIGANQLITNNHFVGTFNTTTGEGRYDAVVINGQVAGIGWLLEPTQTPTISGNSFGDNTTPFLLRGSDNNTANFPTAAQVQHILDTNGDANTHYTYVVTPGGDLETASRNSGAYHSFAVTNTIDTLNFALDTTVDASDPIFGDQRIYIQSGDTVIIQSGATTGALNSQIMVDNLNVKATANSADLNLTLATQFADHSAIANGGVHNVTLLDYALGHGAAVDVTGNGLDNTIVGNSGANTLDGAGGNDTLNGGGGNDHLIGGAGIDTATGYGAGFNLAVQGGHWVVTNGTETDTLDGIEKVTINSHTYVLADHFGTTNGGFQTIQAAIDAAGAGQTVEVAPDTYNESLTIAAAHPAFTLESLAGAASTIINGQGLAYGFSGAVQLADGTSDLTIGGTGHGFTINASSHENAALLLGGHNSGIDIEGNIIVANATAAANPATPNQAVLAGGGQDNVDFVGNTFSGTASQSLLYINGAQNGTPASHDVGFTGNHFSGSAPDGALLVLDADQSSISGNTFDGPAGAALALQQPGNTVGSDNHFENFHGTDIQTADVSFDLSTTPSAHNLEADFAATGVHFTGNSLDNIITGNATFAPSLNVNYNDVLDGAGGNDTLHGDGGDDTLIGGTGNDTLDGGANNAVNPLTGIGGDTADYSSSSVSLNIALTSGGATNVSDGLGGLDTLTGIENLTGGSVGDTLTGDGGNNILIGNGGTNVLNGLGGDDRLVGGDAHDVLNGGSGNDVLIGGAGSDTLSGGDDADRFVYALQSDAGTAVNGGEDQIFGFSHTQGDTFAFSSSFFTANENLTLDDGFGHVKADGLLITDVSGTSYSGSTGQPLFVLDTVVAGSAGTLWFDANGNGSMADAHDVKIATFDNATSLAGFNAHDLLLI
jgi:Ca2+-binding RTX toxin-like protein